MKEKVINDNFIFKIKTNKKPKVELIYPLSSSVKRFTKYELKALRVQRADQDGVEKAVHWQNNYCRYVVEQP